MPSPLWARSCLMWAMGVLLNYLLAAQNTFGVNNEDGSKLVRKWRKYSLTGIQVNVACRKLAEWLRSSIHFVVIILHADSVASRGTAAGL